MTKQKLTVIIIAAAVIAVVGVKIFLSLSAKPIDPSLARSKGEAKARVQVVEFIDFQCPACAAGALKLKAYYAAHPGDIHVTMKYFPLVNAHKHAMTSAMYAECAARQGKFWAFQDLMIERQAQWSPLISAEGMFTQYAREAGMDAHALRACLDSPDVETTVLQDRDLGRSLAVQSTPTYFINDKMTVGIKGLTEEMDRYFQQGTQSK